jgi:ABC-type dipeptide/oligopeptide/nickel transport system ATPase subunit
MVARLPTHNDLPTFEDKLGRETLVQQVALEIATGRPPLVFGIHGDWGSGKTSFLCQLEHELTGECSLYPEADQPKRSGACEDIEHVFTVWFEAWRYQHEPSPVVALLQEICRQLPKHAKIKEVLKKWGTMITKGFFGAIDELSVELEAAPLGAGGKAGVKFKNPLRTLHEEGAEWEKEHLTGRLTTDHIRRLLTDAIKQLLGGDEYQDRRVCVIIDDLDRCEPAAALRLLEGIKIHLSLPRCVFVLGVNLKQIEQAIAPLLPGANEKAAPAEKHAEAAEYLEKLCTFTWKLPFPSVERRGELLSLWLADPASADIQQTIRLPEALRNALVNIAKEYDCLPANPRKIKSLANTIRQLLLRGWPNEKAGQEIAIPATRVNAEADTLLIAASIDHFHTELLRYLQTYPGAWDELIKWANGKSVLPDWSDLARVFQDLQRSAVANPTEQSKPTLSKEPLVPIFPDPVHVSVFRIHRLLREATDTRRNTVDKQSMARYLAMALTPKPAGSASTAPTPSATSSPAPKPTASP